MTIQEAIDVLNTRGEHGNLTGYAAWQTEALDMAVRSLEAIRDIKQIINNTIYIQEDVIRYKAICEVVKGVTE